jgi:hypothetical protein
MQQNDGRAGAVGRVPDANAVVLLEALSSCDRERRSTMRLKSKKVVVERSMLALFMTSETSSTALWRCRILKVLPARLAVSRS